MAIADFPPAFRRSPALPRGFLHPDFYVVPAGIVWGEAAAAAIIAGHGWSLAESGAACTAALVCWREGDIHWAALSPCLEVIEWAESLSPDIARTLGRMVRGLERARPDWAGLSMDRPRIMGIVNVTPDSFSDGGAHYLTDAAIRAGLDMVAAGADIIDVGGESTRPGAQPVPVEDEIARVVPVIQALAQRGLLVSVDTRHAPVMVAALQAGAKIINDVTALTGPDALKVAAASDAALCLMHMQGQPQTMQADPCYDCAPLDVFRFLQQRVDAAMAAGIDKSRLAVDPGIGFGKTPAHNGQILAALPLYHGLGCPLLLGASRKSLIAAYGAGQPAQHRLPGTLALHQIGFDAGVQIVRVHDVAQAVQAAAVWHSVRRF